MENQGFNQIRNFLRPNAWNNKWICFRERPIWGGGGGRVRCVLSLGHWITFCYNVNFVTYTWVHCTMVVFHTFTVYLAMLKNNSYCYTSQLKYVLRWEENMSCVMVQNSLTLLFLIKPFIAPAGFWPRGQNPRRH